MVLNRLFLNRASLSKGLGSTPSGTSIICPDSSVGRMLVSKTRDRGSSPPRVPINSATSYMTYLITLYGKVVDEVIPAVLYNMGR